MTVYLEDCAKESIARHAEGGYPNEICGILLGRDTDGRRVIHNVLPIENSFEVGEQYHRFLITPQAMLKAEQLARYDRMDVLGVYHSHPDAPARPSEYDRDHAAWTTWSYVIVSVEQGRAADMRAWKLNEDRDSFNEEDLIMASTANV